MMRLGSRSTIEKSIVNAPNIIMSFVVSSLNFIAIELFKKVLV